MDKQSKINLFLAIIAILISITSILYTIINDYNIRKVSFDSAGLQNRPVLKFEEKPNKIHYTFETKKPIFVQDLYQKKLSNLSVVLTVDPELNVTNTGVSVAKILCTVVTDKYSGLPEIRKKLFDKVWWDEFAKIELTDDYFKTIDILPGKSHLIRMPHTLNNINFDLNEFTIHYLLIYLNEIGNVYDSYFWMRFKMEPIQATYATDGNTFAVNIDKEQFDGAIKVVDTHFSTFMYSKLKSIKIVDLAEQHMDKLIKDKRSLANDNEEEKSK